jgi:protein-tyrosine phosphatase
LFSHFFLGRYEREKDQLNHDLALLAQDRDTALLNAENERQQLLGLSHQEKNALQERINALKEEIVKQSGEYDRLKRESTLKQEQDRNHLLSLQDDIKNIRTQFEDSIANHEKEIKELNAFLEDLRQQKEAGLRECNELKTLLKTVEDNRDNFR